MFLFVGMTAILLGMAWPAALGNPAIRRGLGLDPAEEDARAWGEIRYIHTGTRVRAARSTSSAVVAGLAAGDSVRADFASDGWYAVFAVSETARDESRALGYVHAPLLHTRPVLSAGLARP